MVDIKYTNLSPAAAADFEEFDTDKDGVISDAEQSAQRLNRTGKYKHLVSRLTSWDKASIGMPVSDPALAVKPAVKKITVNGLADLASGVTQGNSPAAVMTRGSVSYNPNISTAKTSSVSRGYIDVAAKPTGDGFRLSVDTYHRDKNESLDLFLQAEAYDPDSKSLRTITFAVLAQNAKLNPESQHGLLEADIRLSDLNKYLKDSGSSAQVKPGTRLFVTALWDGSNHRAGGPGRGSFEVPKPAGGNAITTRISAVSAAAASVSAEDIPLDTSVPYPSALRRDIFGLAQDGSIVSRLESEYKGATQDPKEMNAAVDRAYALAAKVAGGDKSEVEKIFGKNWTIEPKSRHWIKDSGQPADASSEPGKGFYAGFRVDTKTGWPVLDPMDDTYRDDTNLSYTTLGAVERLRKNDQKQGVLNVKDPGIVDPKTGIRQRIELGLEFKANITTKEVQRALEKLSDENPANVWRDTVFNQISRHMAEVVPGIDLSAEKTDLFKVVQERHKFELKNTVTNVSEELSFDYVTVTTMRPEHADAQGNPRTETFAIFEGELNHLQLNSQNKQDYVASGTTDTKAFLKNDEQVSWMKSSSANTTLDVEPSLHTADQLKNPAFRQTSSYLAFEKANGAALKYFFPNGLTVASQKANYSGYVLGLTPLAQ